MADPDRRPVLVIGDGAAQMTIQDLSPMAVLGLPPIVLLLNNAGYTIERALQSPDAAYNDVAAWDWAPLVAGLTGSRAATFRVSDPAGLHTALEAGMASNSMTFIEVILDRDDVPPLLQALAHRNGGGK